MLEKIDNIKIKNYDHVIIGTGPDVLGSSIFPTAGHVNPTFTICQLALRLGDHLKNKTS